MSCSSRPAASADGASGRNGGQIHSGQRQDQLWLEQKFGFERAKILWDLAEEAKALVRQLIVRFAIPCDLKPGVIEAQHRNSLMREAAELVEALTTRYGYDRVTLLDRAETEAALGSKRFAGAINDRGGGHLDPLRFALGLAKAAAGLGASIHENTRGDQPSARERQAHCRHRARRRDRRSCHRRDGRALRPLRGDHAAAHGRHQLLHRRHRAAW